MYEYKISVILTTYNSSKTIKTLLNSLINQDFNDFELIIVDDKSDDGTVDLIRKNLKKSKLNYSIYVNKHFNGLAFSRNYGISKSKGRYLVFINDTDMVYFNHLSRLYYGVTHDNSVNEDDISAENLENLINAGENPLSRKNLENLVDKNRISNDDIKSLGKEDFNDENYHDNKFSDDLKGKEKFKVENNDEKSDLENSFKAESNDEKSDLKNSFKVDSAFIKGLKLDQNDEFIDFKVDRFDSLFKIAKENGNYIKGTDLINLITLVKIPFCHVFLIYDKEIIIENNLRFNEMYSFGEGMDFALRYLSFCENIRFINRYTYYYYPKFKSFNSRNIIKSLNSISIYENLALDFYEKSFKNSSFKNFEEQLINYMIPKIIFKNINILLDINYPVEKIIGLSSEMGLFDRLKKFKPLSRDDFKYKIGIHLFLNAPDFYFSLRNRFNKSK